MRRYPVNRYPGVNAHLNSYLQEANGLYSAFHHDLITFIRSALDKSLPSNYYAFSEQGLQVNYIDEDSPKKLRIEPDVSVFQTRSGLEGQAGNSLAPIASLPILETEEIEEESLPLRVSIYQPQPNDIRGKLVTAIEVLSPANKPKGGNFQAYSQKRLEFLQTGINLIEIDLLHESPPVLPRLPSYPAHEQEARPYNFLVSTPIPDVSHGKTDWYGALVNSPLPTLPLPLSAKESSELDLQAIYNALFADVRFYHQYVDYDTLPINFNAYKAEDQQQIQAMLEKIRQSSEV